MFSRKCPVCGEQHPYLITQFDADLDQPVLDILGDETAGWIPGMGACTRCLDQAHLEAQLKCLEGTGEPGEVNGYKILPTPVRLMADSQYSGKGVTICMIDSGFVLHPDLIYPQNRVLKVIDITLPRRGADAVAAPKGNAWHGTMTSVVCAGNGHLSGGVYRGIASDANLVLVKVTDESGAITSENIVKALKWAIRNATRYDIRIINLSVTDDEHTPWMRSAVDQAVQSAVEKGIVVVAAAGNDPNAPLKSPANAPHALTVGGLNDRNTLDPLTNTLYHSTFGTTLDAIQKPDLIAPAIWIPAPILPGTDQQREAAALFAIASSSDGTLRAKLINLIQKTKLNRELINAPGHVIRAEIAERINEAKYISAHYQHADGTSFAAPIVCSVIAQMLEANPGLDPATVREILLITAKRLPSSEADRQGWGVISPAHAVQMAAGKPVNSGWGITPVVDYRRMQIDFYLRQPKASSVMLTGDFIKWSREGYPLATNGDAETWKTSIPFIRKGVYRYKFLVDQEKWMSDPRNLFREPDGFNDFNSKLIIL